MDVFSLRDRLTQDYHGYISSFIQIRDPNAAKYAQTGGVQEGEVKSCCEINICPLPYTWVKILCLRIEFND
jgi:hypothetical protein